MFWNITRSDRPAFITPDGSIVSYAKLADDIAEFVGRLEFRPGLIGIQCDGSYSQYVAYLAALNSGSPVLLLGPDHAPEQTGLSLSYLYSAKTDRLERLPGGAGDWHPDLAVLLSTSGSTGEAKWVRLSFANIQANAISIADYLTLTREDRAPMALPFQYSYGMSVVNSHLAVGAALVLAEGSVVDARFWEAFEETGCTSLAGVPHSFELMDQAGIRTDHLTHLRYMTQAGGRLGADRVRAWVERGRTEGWDFVVMYGQTEAAPRISYLPPEMALETPASIGIPVPGGEIWVADEAGERISDGTQGELFYRGPNTMMGYAQSDPDLALGQGPDVLSTGDVARRLPNGAFEIVGRMKRFVKLYGLRISMDEIEKHLRETGVEAVCSARNDRLYVLEVGADADRARTTEQHLADWLGLPGGSFRVLPVDTLPRQASGKVDLRAVDELVERMEAQVEAESRAATGAAGRRGLIGRLMPARRASVADIFRAHFPAEAVTPHASFSELGGDSLSYVAVSLDLEAVLGHLPHGWADMSVAELQASAGGRSWFTNLDMPTLVRALAIIMIVGNHFEAFRYGGGGAKTLMIVAGLSLATFTLPQILKLGTAVPIAILVIRLALLTFAYTLLNFFVTGYGEWPAFLLIGNWISPSVEGSAWFVEVYLQLLCLLAVVFSFPGVRRLFAWRAFPAAAVAALGCVGLAALSDVLVDTHHLYRRLPHLYAWFLMIGVAAGCAKTLPEKGIVTAILAFGYWQFIGYEDFEVKFLPLVAPALIWIPWVPFPRLLTIGLRRIAGASLFIYLSHFQFREVSNALFGPSPMWAWLVAIVGGVLVWRLYEPVDARLSTLLRNLLSDQRKAAPQSPQM